MWHTDRRDEGKVQGPGLCVHSTLTGAWPCRLLLQDGNPCLRVGSQALRGTPFFPWCPQPTARWKESSSWGRLQSFAGNSFLQGRWCPWIPPKPASWGQGAPTAPPSEVLHGGAVSCWNLLVPRLNCIIFILFHFSVVREHSFCLRECALLLSYHIHSFLILDPIRYLSTRNQNP